MNQTTGKKPARFLFMTLAFSALLLCCMGCSKKTPREALEDAYQKTFTDGNPAKELLGLTELHERLNGTAAYSTGFSLTLQELSGAELGEYAGIFSGLGFTVDSASDLSNRQKAGTVDITYGGATCLTLGGQLQDSKLYLTSPQLLDGSLLVDFSTLKEDLTSDSMLGQLASMYGVTISEDLSEDLFRSLMSPASLSDYAALTSACKDLNDAILVQELNKKEVSLPSEVSAKKVYRVTIPESAYAAVINAAIRAAGDYSSALSSLTEERDSSMEDTPNPELLVRQLAEQIGDLVLTVAVTKDGYISYAKSDISFMNLTLALTAFCNVEDHLLTEFKWKAELDADGKAAEMNFTRSFDTKDNGIALSAEISYDHDTLLTFSAKGNYTDVEKGKKYTLDFDFIEFEVEDVLSVSLAGDYYADTTRCEISAPTGTEYPLFRMSEQDFSTLAQTVRARVEKDPLLSGLLNYFEEY